MKWQDIGAEAARCLGEYVRFDTTNPPGNERAAAEYLKGKLLAEGLQVQTFAADPERPNIVCRLKGDGSKRPLILLHHMDVVLAESDRWSVPPFSGAVRDGFLWGRGTLDMKGLGIMELMAFLLARRRSLPLKRDLVYVAVADEETGGSMGAEWLVRNHGDELDAEFLLNEGGTGWKTGKLAGFNLAIGEKGPLWLRVSTQGPPGHGSVPLADNAAVRLANALTRVSGHRRPLQIVEQMRLYLEKVGIDPGITAQRLQEHHLLQLPQIAAMFSNTISLTVLRAGQKENVIPSVAEAVLDCRLLPGVTAEQFLAELRPIIADEAVRLDVIQNFEPSVSPLDTDMYAILEQVLHDNYPGVLVMPTISTGFTDSRCFREKGTACYGLLPFLSDLEVLSTMHGHDERIALESIEKGTKVIFELIERLNA